MSDYIDIAALTKVVLVSLVLGAGVPAVFAVGVRVLATPDGSSPSAPKVAGAVVCFAICLAAVVVGVLKIVNG